MTNQPPQIPIPSSTFGSSTSSAFPSNPTSEPENSPLPNEYNRFVRFFRGQHFSVINALKPQYVFAILSIVLLLIAAGAGLLLVQKSQDIRQQASGGYADCPGGVKNGQRTCSGFRMVAICDNGVIKPVTVCSEDQKCIDGLCGSTLTAASPSHSPQPSPVIASTAPSPSPAFCTYENVRYPSGQCIAYLGLRCNASGYGDPDSTCQFRPQTTSFRSPAPSPSPAFCTYENVRYPSGQCIAYLGLRCNASGYGDPDSGCPSTPPRSPAPSPSPAFCTYENVRYPSGQCIAYLGLRCNASGYGDPDSGCPSTPPTSPQPQALLTGCSGTPSGQCINTSGKRCNNGNEVVDATCPQPQALSVGCADTPSGQCIGTSGNRCNNGNSIPDTSCPQPQAPTQNVIQVVARTLQSSLRGLFDLFK